MNGLYLRVFCISKCVYWFDMNYDYGMSNQVPVFVQLLQSQILNLWGGQVIEIQVHLSQVKADPSLKSCGSHFHVAGLQ